VNCTALPQQKVCILSEKGVIHWPRTSTPKTKHFFAFMSVECERHSNTLRVTSEISCVYTHCRRCKQAHVSCCVFHKRCCMFQALHRYIARHDWLATVQLVHVKFSTNLGTRDPSVGVKIRTRARLRGYSSSIPDCRNRHLSFPQLPEGHWRPTSV